MGININSVKLSKLSLRTKVTIGALIIVAISLAIIPLLTRSRNNNSGVVSADVYKEQLRVQVDTDSGAPRTGRDPASQQQISLGDAASKPTSAGKRTDTSVPATNGTSTTSSPTAVAKEGLGPNGCYIDYGIQGQECLPAHVAVNGTPTCDGVRTHGGFPKGIKVTGTDRYHLDSNHDGIACNSGD